MIGCQTVIGVLLAGGLSRRMGGGDKTLRQLGDRPLLSHVIERATPQVACLALNANGDPARFAALGLPILPDVVEGFAGPLAGILTGLRWAQGHHPDARWLASFAADTPFFPRDLVAKLLRACVEEDAQLACAASGGRSHPVFGLWPVALADALEEALESEGLRKIDLFTARYRLAIATFPTEPFDPFFNINTPEDLAEAERLLAAA